MWATLRRMHAHKFVYRHAEQAQHQHMAGAGALVLASSSQALRKVLLGRQSQPEGAF